MMVVRLKVPAGNDSFFSNRSALSETKPSKAMHAIAGFSGVFRSDADAAVAGGGKIRIRSGKTGRISVDAAWVLGVPEKSSAEANATILAASRIQKANFSITSVGWSYRGCMQTDQDKIIYYSARDRKIWCNIWRGTAGQKTVHIGKMLAMGCDGTFDGSRLCVDASAQDSAAGIIGKLWQMAKRLVCFR